MENTNTSVECQEEECQNENWLDCANCFRDSRTCPCLTHNED